MNGVRDTPCDLDCIMSTMQTISPGEFIIFIYFIYELEV